MTMRMKLPTIGEYLLILVGCGLGLLLLLLVASTVLPSEVKSVTSNSSSSATANKS